MQELLDALKQERTDIIEDVEWFKCYQSIERFIENTFLEKEKKIMVDFAYNCRNIMAADEFAISHWYDKTFNNKEK